MFCCCDLYVSLGSRVSPSNIGLMFMGSVMCMYVFHVGMIGCLLLLS